MTTINLIQGRDLMREFLLSAFPDLSERLAFAGAVLCGVAWVIILMEFPR